MANLQVPAGLIIMIGISGSGKTRWTHARVNHAPDLVCRANRDALRIAHGFRRHGNGRQERVVTAAQNAMIREAFAAGYTTVIVDDTNLNGVSRFKALARELGVPLHIQEFRTVPLATCLANNAMRTGDERLDEQVIRDQYERIQPWLRARAREAGRNRTAVTP